MTRTDRQQYLKTVFLALLGVAAIAASIPFVKSCSPGARERAKSMTEVFVDLKGMEDGEVKRTIWEGKPIIIIKRSSEVVAKLGSINNLLYDPYSNIDVDNLYIQKVQRSIKPEYFVGINISSYCGCSLAYAKKWGGYELPGGVLYDPCHIGTYDVAGRLLANSFMEKTSGPCAESGKMRNMRIPPHQFISETQLKIGDRGE